MKKMATVKKQVSVYKCGHSGCPVRSGLKMCDGKRRCTEHSITALQAPVVAVDLREVPAWKKCGFRGCTEPGERVNDKTYARRCTTHMPTPVSEPVPLTPADHIPILLAALKNQQNELDRKDKEIEMLQKRLTIYEEMRQSFATFMKW
jgi:hypothetical protein